MQTEKAGPAVTMGLKYLLPRSIRDYLRPAYTTLTRQIHRYARSFAPISPQWKALRDRMRNQYSAAELFRISQQEFGVLQQEAEITNALEYIAASRPLIIGEIGLKYGGNSFLFTQTCRTVKQFIGIDLVLQNTDKLQYVAPSFINFRFFEGSSYDPATVQRVRRFLARRQFDFLFIDGDHSLHGVKEDFLQYISFVRPGGLIAFHDIVPDEVARFGTKPSNSLCYGGDVYAFWKRVKQHFEYREFVNSWDQIGFGIGILTLPNEPLTLDSINKLRSLLTSESNASPG